MTDTRPSSLSSSPASRPHPIRAALHATIDRPRARWLRLTRRSAAEATVVATALTAAATAFTVGALL